MPDMGALSPSSTSNGAAEPSLVQQFMAIADANGGLDDSGTSPQAPIKEPEATPEKPVEPAKPAIAAAVDGEADPEEKARPDGPTPDKWATLRKERREFRASVETERAAIAAEKARIEAKAKELESYSPEALKKLLHTGQFNELAKLLGEESWEKVNDVGARAFADPGYLREQELKRKVEALEEERAQEKRELAARAAEAQRQESERQFVSFVDTELKASDEPIIKALAAADPRFTNAVYGYMARHYESTGEQLDVHEAAATFLPDIREQYARLHKILGGQPTANQAETVPTLAGAVTPDRAGSKQPARQAKHVSRTRAAEAAPPVRELSHAEQIEIGKRELEKALAEDLKNGTF